MAGKRLSLPQRALVAATAALALAAGIYLGLHRGSGDVHKRTVDAVYATSLPDLDLHPQLLSQWRNRTLLVNFWASWCVPCREEIPALARVKAKSSPNSVEIVGIALDNPVQARAFAKSLGINYPVLIGGLDTIDLVRPLGNTSGGLPFTLVLAPGGDASWSHLGALTEPEILALLANAQTAAPVAKP